MANLNVFSFSISPITRRRTQIRLRILSSAKRKPPKTASKQVKNQKHGRRNSWYAQYIHPNISNLPPFQIPHLLTSQHPQHPKTHPQPVSRPRRTIPRQLIHPLAPIPQRRIPQIRGQQHQPSRSKHHRKTRRHGFETNFSLRRRLTKGGCRCAMLFGSRIGRMGGATREMKEGGE